MAVLISHNRLFYIFLCVWYSFLLAVSAVVAAQNDTKDTSGVLQKANQTTLTSSIQEIKAVTGDSFFITYVLSGALHSCVNFTVRSYPKTLTNLPRVVTICPDTELYDDRNDTKHKIYFTHEDWFPRINILPGSLNLSLHFPHFANLYSMGRKGIVAHHENLKWVAQFLYTSFSEGIATLSVTSSEREVNVLNSYTKVYIARNSALELTSSAFGWIYTIAWDISFMPQIIHNWRRKSVVGLSFDFLFLNFIGFSWYVMFNVGLLWVPFIQNQYYRKHPTSILHVKLNDVVFPLYALICTSITIVQCFFMEKKDQRISRACWVIVSILLGSTLIYIILAAAVPSVMWIEVLYFMSYQKLAITCIKYAPQLYLHFKMKSTAGWSIHQVFFDFFGGVFSMFQMFLLAENYNDWNSVLADPAKLGLGLMSSLYNIGFFIQHFCLYRNREPPPKAV